MELFFDTETSGMAKWKRPYSDPSQPWVVQLGAIVSDKDVVYVEMNVLVCADGREIEDDAQRVHNIDVETANQLGLPEKLVASAFKELMYSVDLLVCHNFMFDSMLMAAMLNRNGYGVEAEYLMHEARFFCTMKESTDLCAIPSPYRAGSYKWPKLAELYNFLFNRPLVGAHDAMYDIRGTRECYYELIRRREDETDNG